MKVQDLYKIEIAGLLLGSAAILVAGFLYYPRLPSSQIDGIEVIGEAATAIAFLVVIVSIYRFRTSLDQEVYHPFTIGFIFLYFSALLDFVDEFVDVAKILTYSVENTGGVIGAISLVVAFGYWVNQYEERGDILTEQEEQLQQRNEQLEVLNRIIRHDIRNDLNVINGMTELAMDHVDSEGEKYLEKVQRSAVDAVDLTESARDFVEALNDEEERELKPVPLKATLTSQIERAQPSYPEADIQFDNEENESEIEVQADDMLSSVFRNLLVNAVQHNDKDQPVVRVSIDQEDGDVVVSVADNGPGIQGDRKEEVFGRGEKGLESSGTGIGLYLVDNLVEQYGGDVWIEENDPEGCVFKVRLRTT